MNIPTTVAAVFLFAILSAMALQHCIIFYCRARELSIVPSLATSSLHTKAILSRSIRCMGTASFEALGGAIYKNHGELYRLEGGLK